MKTAIWKKKLPQIIKQNKQYFLEDGCYPECRLLLSSIFAIVVIFYSIFNEFLY